MNTEEWRTHGLFADGGCIGGNPSSVGITWAWCYVKNGEPLRRDAGSILVPGGTNNLAEFVAVVLGLEAMADGWSGYLCSDSRITLGRICWGSALNGIPEEWRRRARCAKTRLRRIMPILLQGHPTRADLETGIGKKRNLPVSRWNVWCDRACHREAQAVAVATKEVNT